MEVMNLNLRVLMLLVAMFFAISQVAAQSRPICTNTCVVTTNTKCKPTDFGCAYDTKKSKNYINRLRIYINDPCGLLGFTKLYNYLTALYAVAGHPIDTRGGTANDRHELRRALGILDSIWERQVVATNSTSESVVASIAGLSSGLYTISVPGTASTETQTFIVSVGDSTTSVLSGPTTLVSTSTSATATATATSTETTATGTKTTARSTVPSSAQSTSTSTGQASNEGGQGEDSGSGNKSGLSTGAKIGLGVGIPLGLIMMGLLVWLGFWLGRRDKTPKPSTATGDGSRLEMQNMPELSQDAAFRGAELPTKHNTAEMAGSKPREQGYVNPQHNVGERGGEGYGQGYEPQPYGYEGRPAELPERMRSVNQ